MQSHTSFLKEEDVGEENVTATVRRVCFIILTQQSHMLEVEY
jgi:hypothetical protein